MPRPPKPIAQLKAQGTFNVTRHGDREDEPSSGTAIVCPDWLDGEALEFWKAQVPNLEAMGILDGIDSSSLAGLCVAWSNWRREQDALDSGTGHIYRVACAWNLFSKIASQFGFDPVSRTKLATTKPVEDDPFTEWLKEKNAHRG